MLGTQCSFREFLSASPTAVIVLDGAMGTELEKQGCDVNDPLWSGKTLLETPECIEEVHLSYAIAGARCLVTSSYQVTPESFQKHRGLSLNEGVGLIRRSVQIARAARERFLHAERSVCAPAPTTSTSSSCTCSTPLPHRDSPLPTFFIAGSVGPYGAYLADGSEYSGGYRTQIDDAMMRQFHRARIAALVAEGVDVLALETQAVWTEVLAIVRLVEEEFPAVDMWVSFTASTETTEALALTTTTTEAPPPALRPEQYRLPDGTTFAHALTLLEPHNAVLAVGVNCVPLCSVTPLLQHLTQYTTKPLIAYPNSGEIYDAQTKSWFPPPGTPGGPLDHTLAGNAPAWFAAGARLIGGCCRTSPNDIAQLSPKLDQL